MALLPFAIKNPAIIGQALTEVNDTNVTLTLGGTPASSLLKSVSLTLGWTGQLGLTRGGTAASLTAANGGIVYSTASALAVSAATATAGLALISGASTTPTWFAPTAGSILFAGTSGVLSQDNSNLFWDSTNHRLGIGTSTPKSSFDVAGSMSIGSYGGANAAPTNGLIVSGNVGIGTTGPDAKLQVGDGSAATVLNVYGNVSGSKNSYVRIQDTSGSSIGMRAVVGGVVTMNLEGGSGNSYFNGGGNVGIGTTSPTAYLHIKAGTASANTAPIKLTAGTLLTTPELGALEYTDDGTTGHLYFTLHQAGVVTRVTII